MPEFDVSKLIQSLENFISQMGYSIVPTRKLEKYREFFKHKQDIELLKAIEPDARRHYVDLLAESRAQLRQDLFVLSELNFKRNGYFVDFGATNGIEMSNTLLLERRFGWTGILAEPAKVWHNDLRKNRECHIETKCIWTKSGEILKFNETETGVLSTIDNYSGEDMHSAARERGKKYDVETISLNDMLEKFKAPKIIDYLSIDTEGSEYDILESVDWRKFKFHVITCEHNHQPVRGKIYNLLTKNGYKRKYEHISAFDDWFVLHQA